MWRVPPMGTAAVPGRAFAVTEPVEEAGRAVTVEVDAVTGVFIGLGAGVNRLLSFRRAIKNMTLAAITAISRRINTTRKNFFIFRDSPGLEALWAVHRAHLSVRWARV